VTGGAGAQIIAALARFELAEVLARRHRPTDVEEAAAPGRTSAGVVSVARPCQRAGPGLRV
jgi:hypothetical protein